MELEEAIEILKYELDKSKVCKKYQTHTIDFLKDLDDYIQAIETLLNHLTKQEKMIDLMAERIEYDTEWFFSDLDNKKADEIKQYFEKKVEESE